MQPTLVNLLGTSANNNVAGSKIEISYAALIAAGLASPATASATQIFGAILINAHSWLSTNTDQAVNLTSTVSKSSPYTRNSVNKTLYNYQMGVFGSYTEPQLDVDDL